MKEKKRRKQCAPIQVPRQLHDLDSANEERFPQIKEVGVNCNKQQHFKIIA